ncbi:MAG: heme-binding protein [Deltaproteobacteria bacterium]|nr:heme-binding protein [Deltaproteobacteria bacterium]
MSTPPPNPQVALAYGPALTLDDALRAIDAARAEASARGWPMAIAVVDPAGDLIALARMDDTQLGSIDVAIHKARTAARFRRPTTAFEAAVAQGGAGLRTLTMDVSAIEGGLPCVRADRVVGAIGVSGMLPTQDGEVARAGLAALAG